MKRKKEKGLTIKRKVKVFGTSDTTVIQMLRNKFDAVYIFTEIEEPVYVELSGEKEQPVSLLYISVWTNVSEIIEYFEQKRISSRT